MYFGDSLKEIDNEILELIYYFGKIFHYKEALIYHKYTNFKVLLKNSDNIFLSFNLFNQSLYNYFLSCFLIAGLILLVAMIGAIVLTLNFKSNRKNELVNKQLSRSDNFLTFLK